MCTCYTFLHLDPFISVCDSSCLSKGSGQCTFLGDGNCCPFYVYNNAGNGFMCVDECPSGTLPNNNSLCLGRKFVMAQTIMRNHYLSSRLSQVPAKSLLILIMAQCYMSKVGKCILQPPMSAMMVII